MPAKLLGGTRTNASAGAPPFAPTDIAGLRLWLKADSLALVDGNPVTTWTDSSAGGFNATQGTAASKPTYKTAIVGGKPVVRFDGSDDYMTIANGVIPWGTAAWTLFVVMQTTDTSFCFLGSQNGGSAGLTCEMGLALSPGRLGVSKTGISTDDVPNIFDASFHILTYRDLAASMEMYNGSAALTVTNAFGHGSILNSATLVGLGARYTSIPATDGYLTGDIAEVILYPSTLSTTNRDLVITYLKGRYSLP